jgi:hypothetical protein
MTVPEPDFDGVTRIAFILGVPLADDVERQWPQMGEVVRGRELVGRVEEGFPKLTLAIGRRLQFDDVVVAEWTCDYGDGRLFRNVTIGELEDGRAVRVTDYWGEPTDTTRLASIADRAPRHARRRNLACRRPPRTSLICPRLTTSHAQHVIYGDGRGECLSSSFPTKETSR